MNTFADDTTLYCTLARTLYQHLRKRLGDDVADKALNPFVLPQLKMELVSGRLDKSLTGDSTHEFQPSSLHT